MKKIIESSELPENEQVYLKKDMFGWRIVQPIKNPDGSINWLNLLVGGWRNLTFLLIVLICLGAVLYAYNHDVTQIQQFYGELALNPRGYCEKMFLIRENTFGVGPNLTINFSIIQGGGG